MAGRIFVSAVIRAIFAAVRASRFASRRAFSARASTTSRSFCLRPSEKNIARNSVQLTQPSPSLSNAITSAPSSAGVSVTCSVRRSASVSCVGVSASPPNAARSRLPMVFGSYVTATAAILRRMLTNSGRKFSRIRSISDVGGAADSAPADCDIWICGSGIFAPASTARKRGVGAPSACTPSESKFRCP